MADILHQIQIDSTVEKVYKAITTEEGLKSWWTTDAKAEPKKDSVARFGFPGHTTIFHTRIDELIPNRRVVWFCTGEDPEWKDTILSWDLDELEGKTMVSFAHKGWRSTAGYYAMCNTTWGLSNDIAKRVC